MESYFSKQIEPSVLKELSAEEQKKIDNYYKEEAKRKQEY